jgi:hypothetical protein
MITRHFGTRFARGANGALIGYELLALSIAWLIICVLLGAQVYYS